VLQSQFQRAYWGNLQMRLQLIGDEFRNQLETLVLWAIQDTGATHLAGEQALTARALIDRHLNSRLMLEITRACADKDWLLAVELRRRMVLWSGPGDVAEQQRDALKITLSAAVQAIQETYRTLSAPAGVRFEGFETPAVPDFFREQYPDIPVVDARGATDRTVVVHKYATDADATAGYAFALDRLIDLYRINTMRVDVSQL